MDGVQNFERQGAPDVVEGKEAVDVFNMFTIVCFESGSLS